MCRIFGFRSVLQSGVHQSLIDADNAIIQQSEQHPDGWGVAYYKLGSPHVIKMDSKALDCKIFEKISGVVSSDTVIAHIRKSTVGGVGPLNTHPFQFGQWVFAHNGNLENFADIRQDLIKKIDKNLSPFIFGETDSEILFYLLLTIMKKHQAMAGFSGTMEATKKILIEFLREIQSTGCVISESQGDYDKNYLTFLITNGKTLVGFNGGQPLSFSTHKKKCPERDSCGHFQPICENQASSGDQVHHLLITSEKIHNANVWQSLKFGEFVGVTNSLHFFKGEVRVS